MKKFNNKTGFTLIEIILVFIIVSILVTIALPNLFNNIVQSRAQEALGVTGAYRPTIEACIIKSAGVNDSAACTAATLGNPTASVNFTYALTAPASATDTGYSITATGQNVLTPGDKIIVTRAAAAWPAFGAVTCTGTGKLLNGCCIKTSSC